MTEGSEAAIALARAQERLRQEQIAFDVLVKQNERSFLLSLVLGWFSAVVILAVGGIAAWIIFHQHDFDHGTVKGATLALFGDALGAGLGIWRGLAGREPTQLVPTTTALEIE
jgi:hypothetical protein